MFHLEVSENACFCLSKFADPLNSTHRHYYKALILNIDLTQTPLQIARSLYYWDLSCLRSNKLTLGRVSLLVFVRFVAHIRNCSNWTKH